MIYIIARLFFSVDFLRISFDKIQLDSEGVLVPSESSRTDPAPLASDKKTAAEKLQQFP